jgi:hypothetical protein
MEIDFHSYGESSPWFTAGRIKLFFYGPIEQPGVYATGPSGSHYGSVKLSYPIKP